MVGGLASLTTAFGNVGGEAGKTLTTVAQLASGLAAGGPLGLAVAGISLAFGKWLEKTQKLKDELEGLTKLSKDYDQALRSAQLAAMPDRERAAELEIDDRLFERRTEILDRYGKLIKESVAKQRALQQSARESGLGSVANQSALNEQREITTQLAMDREKEIAKIVQIAEYERQALANKRAQNEEEKKQKDLTKFLAEARKREHAMAEALLKIQKEMVAEEMRLAKLRTIAVDRMRKNAPKQVSSAYDTTATITTTGRSGVGQAGDHIAERIKGGTPYYGDAEALAGIFNIDIAKALSGLGTQIAASVVPMLTAIGTAIVGFFSSPALLAIIAGVGVAAMWASIPVVVAQWVALFASLAVVGAATMAWMVTEIFGPLKYAAIAFAFILGAIFSAATIGTGALLLLGSSTEAAAQAQERIGNLYNTFAENAFSPIYKAMFPLIAIIEILALRFGQAFGSVFNFYNASEAAFNALKQFTLMILDAALGAATALEVFVNGLIQFYNQAILPMIQTLNPGAQAIGKWQAPGKGFVQMARDDVYNLSFTEAMFGNTAATKENTRALERLTNLPSGYRLNSAIWRAQNPSGSIPLNPIGGAVPTNTSTGSIPFQNNMQFIWS